MEFLEQSFIDFVDAVRVNNDGLNKLNTPYLTVPIYELISEETYVQKRYAVKLT